MVEKGNISKDEAITIFDVKSKLFLKKKNSLIEMANDDSLSTIMNYKADRTDHIHVKKMHTNVNSIHDTYTECNSNKSKKQKSILAKLAGAARVD